MTDTVNAPAPEPAPAAPAPAGPVDTSFLDAAIAPDVSNPGAPQYANDYRSAPPQPQYQQSNYGPPPQQYGYRPNQNGEEDLNDLVGNTRGYITNLVNQVLAERADPMLSQMSIASGQVSDFISSTADAEAYNAKNNIDGLFQTVFRQDEDYMSNPNLAAAINMSIGNMLRSATNDARRGKFDGVKKLSSWGPNQAKAALAASKQMFGSSAQSSAPVGGGRYMATETSRAPVQNYNVEITPDEEGVIAFRERLDPSFRERFIVAKQKAIERGDWEF